ncbi:MAG: NucA/NucB deoxyribonuclease domain-containing protein, partial [Rubrivivax sp.]
MPLGAVHLITSVGTTMVRGSWEEYPFAATSAARAGFVVDRVPLRENWIQGGFIRAAS